MGRVLWRRVLLRRVTREWIFDGERGSLRPLCHTAHGTLFRHPISNTQRPTLNEEEAVRTADSLKAELEREPPSILRQPQSVTISPRGRAIAGAVSGNRNRPR
jgi:hypothetical protein